MNWYLKVLKQYFDFDGRARRKEYWMFFLINIIISYGIQEIGVFLNSDGLLIAGSVYSLAVLIPGIAVGVRRIHDGGKNGWYLLIPIYNIVLLATEGEHGPNEYGENPKGMGNADAINQIGQE